MSMSQTETKPQYGSVDILRLLLKYGARRAPRRLELHGSWGEVVVPLDKNHCAHILIPSDSMQILHKIMEMLNAGTQNKEKQKNMLPVGKVREDILRKGCQSPCA